MIDFAEFKRFFIFNLIGSLVISSLVAVITVLIGQFNEVAGKVLLTLLMVIIHSLISLAFIWDDERQKTFERLSFFINTIFILIVASFLASIFGVWEIFSGKTIWHIYQTFFVIGFASLHGDMLSKALHKEGYMDRIIYANYFFIVIVVLMLQPWIYVENATKVLGEMYFRILGAMSIIDGTLSMLTIIFYRMYAHKHPETENPLYGEGANAWVWVLIIYLLILILFPLFYVGFGKFF